MLKKNRGENGYSLIEVIIAMTVFAMISLPLVMLFSNSMKLTKSSEEQIELNAITRIVRENVAEAIKNCATVHGNSSGYELRTAGVPTDTLHTLNDVIILDHASTLTDNPYEGYRFNAKPLSTATDSVHRFEISIKRKNGPVIRTFIVEANKI